MHEQAQFFVGWGTLSLINAGLAQSKGRSGLLVVAALAPPRPHRHVLDRGAAENRPWAALIATSATAGCPWQLGGA